MKRILLSFVIIFGLCVYMKSQTLISRAYQLSPSISYKVYEPEKDTIYYWTLYDEPIGSFNVRFKTRKDMCDTFRFIMSLEADESGRTYILDKSMDKNRITTGKVEKFLFFPEEHGITIYEKNDLLSSYRNLEGILEAIKPLGLNITTLRQKKKDEKRYGKKRDDMYKY